MLAWSDDILDRDMYDMTWDMSSKLNKQILIIWDCKKEKWIWCIYYVMVV